MRFMRRSTKPYTPLNVMRVAYVDDHLRIIDATIEITITERASLGAWLVSGATGNFSATAHLRRLD